MSQVPADTTPVQSFADCHAGILQSMTDLAALPALIEAERRAQAIRGQLKHFYDDVVLKHHAEEEQELFPAAREAAAPGAERAEVERMIEDLTRQHRHIEAGFAKVLPALLATRDPHAPLPVAHAVQALAAEYTGHARFEELHFLPLATRLLQRRGNDMAALAMSLHIRHSTDAVRRRFGYI